MLGQWCFETVRGYHTDGAGTRDANHVSSTVNLNMAYVKGVGHTARVRGRSTTYSARARRGIHIRGRVPVRHTRSTADGY